MMTWLEFYGGVMLFMLLCGMHLAMDAPLLARLLYYLNIDSVLRIIGLLDFKLDLPENSPHFRQFNGVAVIRVSQKWDVLVYTT